MRSMFGTVNVLRKNYRYETNPFSNANKIAQAALDKWNRTMLFYRVYTKPKILQLNEKQMAGLFLGKDKNFWEEMEGEKVLKLESSVEGFYYFWYPDLIFYRKEGRKVETTITHEMFHYFSHKLGLDREELLYLEKVAYWPRYDYAKQQINYSGEYWFRYLIVKAIEEAAAFCFSGDIYDKMNEKIINEENFFDGLCESVRGDEGTGNGLYNFLKGTWAGLNKNKDIKLEPELIFTQRLEFSIIKLVLGSDMIHGLGGITGDIVYIKKGGIDYLSQSFEYLVKNYEGCEVR
jgi:hypothetical protein